MGLFAVNTADGGVAALIASCAALARVGCGMMVGCADSAGGLVFAEDGGVSIQLTVTALRHVGGWDEGHHLACPFEEYYRGEAEVLDILCDRNHNGRCFLSCSFARGG